MKILLCCNGSKHSIRGLEMGTDIARAAAKAVDILAVPLRDRDEITRRAVEETEAVLQAAHVPVAVEWKTGRLAEQVLDRARAMNYDLLVIGSRGRRGFLRLLLGSTALYVSGRAPTSVLVVKGPSQELRRFLVGTAAGPVSEETALFTCELAKRTGASVSLLHVMSQVPLTPRVSPSDLEASAEELMSRGSREGNHLNSLLELISGKGLAARAVIRYGLVRDEIVAELHEGQYDLLAIGAHVAPGLNARLLDNLTADILLAADCSVMIVAHGRAKERDANV